MLKLEDNTTGGDENRSLSEINVLEGDTKSKAMFALDLLPNILYHPNGITRPFTYRGYFNTSTEYGKTQKRLFDELLADGFRREFFQIVFPGQTAGIVKVIENNPDFDEAHIRFYNDGAIDIELEQGRFSKNHWGGERILGHEYLISLLEGLDISSGDKHYIENHLLKDKQMHKLCELSTDNDYFMRRISFTILFLWEYGLGTIVLFAFIYFLSKDF